MTYLWLTLAERERKKPPKDITGSNKLEESRIAMCEGGS
jgi:hypothetical protein